MQATANPARFLAEPGRAEIWLQGMWDFGSLSPVDQIAYSAQRRDPHAVLLELDASPLVRRLSRATSVLGGTRAG